MSDNTKKDITKIGDLADFEHDDIDFESATDLFDESNTEEEIQADEVTDIFDTNHEQEALTLEEELEAGRTKIQDSPTLLSEIHDFQADQEFIDLEKEATTIQEIDKEIETTIQPISDINEPLNAKIPRNIPIQASPSYSLKVYGLGNEYLEDIKKILMDMALEDLMNEEFLKRSLDRKELFIPRIPELIGIQIIHLVKRLGATYLYGLSEDVFPSEYDSMDYGSLSKEDNEDFKQKEILTSTSDHIDGIKIKKLGKLISVESYLEDNQDLDLKTEESLLLESLKLKAIREKADAIIGITTQHLNHYSKNKIKVLVSGTLAWIR